MLNLHSIRTSQSIFAWLSIVGGNGHILGGGVEHLYRATRNEATLPPLGDTARSWWHTWEPPNDNALNPPCGPIRTRARNVWLSEYHPARHCPNCTAWAEARNIQANRLSFIRTIDPWTRIDWNSRPITIDPVSGL